MKLEVEVVVAAICLCNEHYIATDLFIISTTVFSSKIIQGLPNYQVALHFFTVEE